MKTAALRLLLWTFLAMSCGMRAAEEPLPPRGPDLDLLAPWSRKHWQTETGKWSFKGDTLTGAGDSKATFERSFRPPFRLSFDIEVLDGMRPRVHVGRFWFGNEGFARKLSLYPDSSNAKKIAYTTGQKHHVQIDVTTTDIEARLDGNLVDKRPAVIAVIPPLVFQGGDGWSPGATRYSNIKVMGTVLDAKSVAMAR